MAHKRRKSSDREKEIRMKLEKIYREVGGRVASVMQRKGFDDDMLALIVGVTPEDIRKLREGERPTNGFFMERVARALEVPFLDIYPDIDTYEW
jgi:ribosome-binding protein aMBF1 (putative translation factor)